jgi:hypothetical protein
MIQYLRLRWEIWRLERADRAEQKKTREAVQAAKASNATDAEIKYIIDGYYASAQYRRIEEAKSDYLVARAERLMIPVPSLYDSKTWIFDGGCRYLTREAFVKLRSDIRAEEKARAERLLIWVPGVVGIIGALTGLAAVILGRR